MVYYKGEIVKTVKGTHKCEYYQAMISYNTNERIQNELQCIESSAKSFSKDLPN
jgi:hypothetical protein